MNWKINTRPPTRREIFAGITFSLLACLSLFAGYIIGYYEGSGTTPFVRTRAILPAGIGRTTSTDVAAFLSEDETKLEQYREGFNCVEFALMAARNAQWKGVAAVPIRLVFDEGAHWILGFPTQDQGWLFLNPQGELWLKPTVGGKFFDKTIVGVYYLYDFVWKPIEWEDK